MALEYVFAFLDLFLISLETNFIKSTMYKKIQVKQIVELSSSNTNLTVSNSWKYFVEKVNTIHSAKENANIVALL